MTSAFGSETTADEALAGLDLSGRRILVTGVSAGLGTETARALLARGATVIGTARDLDKARAAFDAIPAFADPGDRLDLRRLDLASLSSVRDCAGALVDEGRPIDVVIANAGVMACPQGVTADGFETQFGTNHLGHFLLIDRIMPLLRAGARVVSLSSAGHRWADVDLGDPQFEHTPYTEFVAYARSKTANILFAVELDRRYRPQHIRATAVHPGGIQTELSRHLNPAVAAQITTLVNADPDGPPPAFQWKSIAQGAATSVWAAVVADADLVGGRYCEDCGVAPIIEGEGIRSGVRGYALDPERAEALWALSKKIVAAYR